MSAPGRQLRSGSAHVGQLQDGAVLEPAVKYQRLAQTQGVPRHSH